MNLLNAQEGKAALEAALESKYLAVDIPNPEDRRLLFQRSFEVCEAASTEKIICYSGDERTGKLVGCADAGSTENHGYVQYKSECTMPETKAKEVEAEPMCKGGTDVDDADLRWGVSFSKEVP